MFTKSKERCRKMADADLIAGSVSQPWMFEILVERYEKPLLKRGESILRDSVEAQDAVQDTFIKVYQNALEFREKEGASFRSWLYTILINTCYSRLRGSRQEAMTSTYEFADLDGIVVESWSTTNQLYVEEILSAMPERFALVLRGYYLEGRSQQELAFELGLSHSTVRSKLHRAREHFRTISYKFV